MSFCSSWFITFIYVRITYVLYVKFAAYDYWECNKNIGKDDIWKTIAYRVNLIN